MDAGGTSDPFVEIALSSRPNALKVTKVVKKNLTPSWAGQEFVFRVADRRYESLLLVVNDKDEMGKDFMGQLELELTEIGRQQQQADGDGGGGGGGSSGGGSRGDSGETKAVLEGWYRLYGM